MSVRCQEAGCYEWATYGTIDLEASTPWSYVTKWYCDYHGPIPLLNTPDEPLRHVLVETKPGFLQKCNCGFNTNPIDMTMHLLEYGAPRVPKAPTPDCPKRSELDQIVLDSICFNLMYGIG